MSTTKNDGGPAFPVPNDALFDGQTGTSLRDWFAGQAMAALIVDPDRADQSREECARLSFLIADAMLEARK
jgi:hypothetical protein